MLVPGGLRLCPADIKGTCPRVLSGSEEMSMASLQPAMPRTSGEPSFDLGRFLTHLSLSAVLDDKIIRNTVAVAELFLPSCV